MGKVVSYRQDNKILPNQLLLMFRQRSGLTQSQLAMQLGLKSDRMVQKWEGGYTLPTAPRLQYLIKFYSTSGVFIAGQESAEASQLWQAVKDMYDHTTATYESYPVFDAAWFEQLRREVVSAPSFVEVKLGDFPHNLPVPTEKLLGRETAVAAVIALLSNEQIRLVTLTGVGGTGKTRLALAVAQHFSLSGEYKDGVYFLELETITERNSLISSLSQTFGIKEKPGQPMVETIKSYLAERQLLLVLDNFEQLVTEAATLLSELVQAPRLKMLVTSRELLHLSFEQEYAVEPLALPEIANKITSIEQTIEYSAIALFVQRAQAVKPSFKLTAQNAASVIAICRKLDGLPLAIELAAVWVKLLSPQQLLERLNLGLLAQGSRDLSARRQTLHGMIEWSYNLLDEAEKQLFLRLAIFAGGCNLEAAEAVCSFANESGIEMLNGLGSLLNKNLIKQSENIEGETRFAMLQTIREYALEKLKESGEADVLEANHFDYFLQVAETAAPKIHDSPEQGLWLDRIEEDLDNLYLALAWGLEHEKWEEFARLCTALAPFWSMRSYYIESRYWLEIALSHEAQVSPSQLAALLTWAGQLAIYLADYTKARVRLEKAVLIKRELGDKKELISSLILLVGAYFNLGAQNYPVCFALCEEALALSLEVGDKTKTSMCHTNLATLESAKADSNSTTKEYFHLQAANEFASESGNKLIQSLALNNLGAFALATNDLPQAISYLQKALELNGTIRRKFRSASIFWYLGEAYYKQGAYSLAHYNYKEALINSYEVDFREITILSLANLGMVAVAYKQYAMAIILFGAFNKRQDDIILFNKKLMDFIALLPPVYETARQELGAVAFDEAFAQGQKMSLGEAVEFARHKIYN